MSRENSLLDLYHLESCPNSRKNELQSTVLQMEGHNPLMGYTTSFMGLN